jgi:8-oxo-dGTP pyrophosphatase MutT (NUDIX family)
VGDDALPGARVALVDVYVIGRGADGGLHALTLRRATGRSPGSWEAVHGHIEGGERPAETAWREVIEETGLTPGRLYNLSRVESFYLHRMDAVALVPAFVAMVSGTPAVTVSNEHDRAEWLPIAEARGRMAWPRCRRALDDIAELLAGGDAGPLEDVLRVR